jgi:hypothetical protein
VKQAVLYYLLPCQIWAEDNSSTCTFTMGKSYWWNRRNTNIVFAWFNYTPCAHI